MRLIITGDPQAFLKTKLEEAGHKVFVVGPNSPEFPVRMEMFNASHAQQALTKAAALMGGLPDAVIHTAVLESPFSHALHANVTARFVLTEALLAAHAQPKGEAIKKGFTEPRDREDPVTGEKVEKEPEAPLDLRVVHLIGFPKVEELPQVRVSKVSQLALAMDLSERIEALGLPLSSTVVSAPEGEGVQVSQELVASTLVAALASPPSPYSFFPVQ